MHQCPRHITLPFSVVSEIPAELTQGGRNKCLLFNRRFPRIEPLDQIFSLRFFAEFFSRCRPSEFSRFHSSKRRDLACARGARGRVRVYVCIFKNNSAHAHYRILRNENFLVYASFLVLLRYTGKAVPFLN
jgi:hypothetical protein